MIGAKKDFLVMGINEVLKRKNVKLQIFTMTGAKFVIWL